MKLMRAVQFSALGAADSMTESASAPSAEN
jgi:hypothetical protein